ncbi:MAG: DUF2795 domain-containing protein [Acidimicrobiia bacterium]
MDDDLAKEVDGLLQGAALEREDRDPELPGDDEVIEIRVGPTVTGSPGGISTDDVHERSELARWLQPSSFPADAMELLRQAGEAGAPDDVLALLGRLPSVAVYDTVGAVWRATGGAGEERAVDAAPPVVPPVDSAGARRTVGVPERGDARGAAPVHPGGADGGSGPLGTLVGPAMELVLLPARLGWAVLRRILHAVR